jgi:hypothetical protein
MLRCLQWMDLPDPGEKLDYYFAKLASLQEANEFRHLDLLMLIGQQPSCRNVGRQANQEMQHSDSCLSFHDAPSYYFRDLCLALLGFHRQGFYALARLLYCDSTIKINT